MQRSNLLRASGSFAGMHCMSVSFSCHYQFILHECSFVLYVISFLHCKSYRIVRDSGAPCGSTRED